MKAGKLISRATATLAILVVIGLDGGCANAWAQMSVGEPKQAGGPEPIDNPPAPLACVGRMKFVSKEKGEFYWARGLYCIKWRYESPMSVQEAYKLIDREVHLDPHTNYVEKRSRRADPHFVKDGLEVRITLQAMSNVKDRPIAAEITQYPPLSGPLPKAWWRPAISPEPPAKLVPMPFGDHDIPSLVQRTPQLSGYLMNEGFMFGAIVDRPLAAVLADAKLELLKSGFHIETNQPNPKGSTDFVNYRGTIYMVWVGPLIDSSGKAVEGRTVVNWFWTAPRKR